MELQEILLEIAQQMDDETTLIVDGDEDCPWHNERAIPVFRGFARQLRSVARTVALLPIAKPLEK